MDYSCHEQLDVLFVSEHALWPVDQGFSIRGSNMVQAMGDKGVRVAVASIAPLPDEASNDLKANYLAWPDVDANQTQAFLKGWEGPGYRARMRLADYQGRDLDRFAGVMSLVEKHQPKTVIGLGQHSILMLRALSVYPQIRKVWYAADELVYFQLSCMRREGLPTLRHRLELLTLYAGLETFFVRGLDGAIGVAPREAKLLKHIAGAKRTTCIRNGVDTDYFAPPASRPANKQLVFWGRMDFEPNIDAVTWFCNNVWPQLQAKHPDATFKVVGKKPTDTITALDAIDGVEIVGGVADLRPYVHGSSATVMPMRCGGGIKNKLLEAAAMGIPIIGSPKATLGLKSGDGALPVLTCKTVAQWISSIELLWNDPQLGQRLGRALRQWVMAEHSWPNAASQMLLWLDDLRSASGVCQRHTPIVKNHVLNLADNKEAA
jgi:glycosyltransferase involved in cell wall biosynthesis